MIIKVFTQRFVPIVLSLCVLAIASAPSHAQSAKKSLWETYGSVHAVVKSGRILYIGGTFTYVGPSTGSGVYLNATTGLLDPLSPRVNGEVFAVVPDGNNGWYIGGGFTAINGIARSNIAHILPNGSVDTWNPQADGPVYTMAFGPSGLYVGGSFTRIGGLPRNNIALLSLANGTPLAWNPNANAPVWTIAVVGPTVYVGGDFTTIGTVQTTRNFAAELDSVGNVSRWNPNLNNRVNAITTAIGQNAVWLGGMFTRVDTSTRNYLASVTTGSGIATFWNPAPNGFVNAVQLIGNKIYVGGNFTATGGQPRGRLALLDPFFVGLYPWNPNANGPVNSIVFSARTFYVGGSFSSLGGMARNNLAAVDTAGVGTILAWNPFAGSTVNAVGVQGNVFAGGQFTSVNGVPRNNLAALYDTSGVVASFDPNVLGGVDALALVGSTLYVGGAFTTIGTQTRTNLAAINATTGIPTTWNPQTNGAVRAMKAVGQTIYVGGSFTTVGSLTRSGIAAIDATSGLPTVWNPNANDAVLTIDVTGTNVYSGGLFSSIGGQTRNRIAALDIVSGSATGWDPDAGNDQRYYVSSLLAFGQTVYAGGQFTTIGGQPRNSLAALNGTTGAATTFNATLNSLTSVDALARGANNLYVGGFLNEVTSDLISVDPISGVANDWDPQLKGTVGAIVISDSTVYTGGAFTSIQNDVRSNFAGIVDASLLLPALFINPPSLNFGNVVAGQPKADSVLVINIGGSSLNITSIVSNNPRFSVSPPSTTIPPNGSRYVLITFSPTVAGGQAAAISFTHNAPGSPATVSVSGTGIAPALMALPRLIVFNEIGVGSRMDTTVHLINVGNASLRVDSVRLRGRDASDFILVGSSGPFSPVAPGDTVNVTLRFAPLTVDTLKSALLLVHSDASPTADTVTIRGRSRNSFVQVNITGDTTVGLPVNIDARPPLGFTVTRAVLHYRAAGKFRYDTLALGPSGQAFAGTFPESVVTPRGIEYYVRLIGIQGTITNPENNPINNPAIVRVKVASLASPQQFVQRAYKMISVPLDLNNADLANQLVDDYGSYNPSRWRLFRWEIDHYAEFPLIGRRLTPGSAFWLITHTGRNFDAKDGRSVSSARPFAIVLEPGWNQIASPFAFPVLWESIANSSNVRPPFFYDGVEFVPNILVVNPWEGYFVLNDSSQAITLSVPPVEAAFGLPKHTEPFTLIGEHDYIIQISADAAAAGLRDRYNYVGMMKYATSGYDMIDLPDPPMIGDYVTLSMVDNGRSFAANFKPLSNEGQQWEMRLSSTLPNQTVRVSFNETGVLPSGFDVYILDEDEFAPVPLGEQSFAVQLGAANSIRSFKVIVGTKAYAEHASAGIPLTPVEYALAQNYPNPFNPSTTIRYSLHKRSDVVLEIYNTLGQKVKSLVSGEQTTGTYSIVWDGSGDAGGSVSSGVYFYRLRAGDFLSSKKLLLLR